MIRPKAQLNRLHPAVGNQKYHFGGGKMKKGLMSLIVLTTILVAILLPLTQVTSAKAQGIQFPNCANGVCTFPLARSWGGGDCEFNILHTLETVGQGQSFWLIPDGNTVAGVSFNSAAKSMETKDGYRKIYNDDNGNKVEDLGENMPGRCACDVASMFYITGLANGYTAQPESINHYAFPGVTDRQYSVAIYNPGKNMFMPNNTGKDIVYSWKIEGGNIVMSMEIGGVAPVINTPVPGTNPVATPENGIKIWTPSDGVPPTPKSDWMSIVQKIFGVDFGVVGPVIQLLLGVIVVGFLVVLYLLAQNKRLESEVENKPVEPYYRIRWWVYLLLIVFAITYLVHKDAVLWILTDYVFQIAAFLWVSRLVARIAEFFNVNTQAFVPRLIRDMSCLAFVLTIGVQVGGTSYSVFVHTFQSGEFNIPLARFVPMPKTSDDWKTPSMDLPSTFVQTVMDYRTDAAAIAQEEGVPGEVPLTLWLKESGGRKSNPDNGEGICGFHDLAASGTMTFTPGPLTRAQILVQLRLCAKEFKKRSSGITFETTDLSLLGPVYMRYNGNIDCNGKPFADYTSHPYVMNGWDASHLNMMARDGKGGCVSLKIIGALPAHVRIGLIMRSPRVKNETVAPPPTLPIVPGIDPLAPICSDKLGFCGFALPGGPANYIQGTSAIGGNGFHCNQINECGWDYWDSSKSTSAVKPINVLSMLNGRVSSIGVYGNGTPYLEVTNDSGRKQAAYHCDMNYVAVGDTVTWGQPICLMGNQGYSDWTHLHLVLLNTNGSSINDQTQWWPK